MGKIKLPKTSAPRAPAPPKTAIPAPPPIPEAGIPAPSLSRSMPAPPPPDFLKLKPTPALVKLKQNADALNAITDAASDSVRSIEAFLSKDCSIGFDISIAYSDKNYAGKKHLGYHRIGHNYRIAISIDSQFQANMMAPKAWSDCSRTLKIESIKYLPALIEAISKKVEDDIAEAKVATNSVADILSSLTGNEG